MRQREPPQHMVQGTSRAYLLDWLVYCSVTMCWCNVDEYVSGHFSAGHFLAHPWRKPKDETLCPFHINMCLLYHGPHSMCGCTVARGAHLPPQWQITSTCSTMLVMTMPWNHSGNHSPTTVGNPWIVRAGGNICKC